jgi:AraC family transcriptional regulator
VPNGMVSRTIPAHLYAVFRHDGAVSSLPDTMKYIWGSWLPKSDYEYVEKPDFELYSTDVQSKKTEKTLFLHIPVSPKSGNR